MINKHIAIIGIGHIAHALIHGWLTTKTISPSQLTLANPHLDKLDGLKKEFKLRCLTDNKNALKNADIVILTVRPRVIRSVIEDIKDSIIDYKAVLIISVAACATQNLLEHYFYPKKVKLIRIMPNIGVMYGKGVVGWIGNNYIKKEDKQIISRLLSPLGRVIVCKNDEDMNRLSMISGSGPAYVAYFMNQLELAALAYGFSENNARTMVQQTFEGTLNHLATTHVSADELVRQVATKGGITEEVINNLEAKNFSGIFNNSLAKGLDKIIKITKELESDRR